MKVSTGEEGIAKLRNCEIAEFVECLELLDFYYDAWLTKFRNSAFLAISQFLKLDPLLRSDPRIEWMLDFLHFGYQIGGFY